MTYVSLRRVRLNQGGYDATGRYWGIAEPLYVVDCPCRWQVGEAHYRAHYVRAANRATAATIVRGHFAHMGLNVDVRS